MTNLINKKIEEFEKRYENSKEQFRGKMSWQDKAFVKAFLHQALTQQLDELKEKVERIKFTDLPLNAPSILLEPENCVTAFKKKGYNQALSDILTLIDSMK